MSAARPRPALAAALALASIAAPIAAFPALARPTRHPGAGARQGPLAVVPGRRHAEPRYAADCEPTSRSCLLPFPNDLYTRPDRSSATGLRVALPPAAMPRNRNGHAIPVAAFAAADGFSPGSVIVVHVPALDTPQALAASGAAGITDIGRSLAAGQPIALVDERSGERVPVWSELDATAPTPASSDLLVHPARALREGDTYAVAIRSLRSADGKPLPPAPWFAQLLDALARGPVRSPVARSAKAASTVEAIAATPSTWSPTAQRARLRRTLRALARAGIARHTLYAAWDFTVASRGYLTGRLLAMRDAAFARLGDRRLADGHIAGSAPAATLGAVVQLTPQLRAIDGVLDVPCFLRRCGEAATAGFHYASARAGAPPSQLPGHVAHVAFECVIPATATPQDPARLVLYGHGFLSTYHEVRAPSQEQLALTQNMVICSTDWLGLAQPDGGALVAALRHPERLPAVAARVQQGVLDMLYLGRLMVATGGLAAAPQLQSEGRPIVDPSALYYDGNSDGGILGGILTAVEPDVRAAVLGVTGIDFFGLMVPRGHAFSSFGAQALSRYADPSLHPLVLDLLQQLWDSADPVAYAESMTAHPLPDTPPHRVLMQIAYGDFEVTMYAAAMEARTIGAYAHEPALDLEGDRARDAGLLWGVPPIAAYPFSGSAIVLWDSGSGRTQPPPLADIPPQPAPGNSDPHEDPRYTPAAQAQIGAFLRPSGGVAEVCEGGPCRSSSFVP